MNRKFEIQIGEYSLTASLLEKEAPRTCEAFWRLLPIESDIHHAKFAGCQMFFMLPEIIIDEYPPKEGRIKVFEAESGDICWWQPRQYVTIFYGEQIHEPVDVSRFAKIEELGKLTIVGRNVWLKPGGKVLVKRK